jgi:hypothetical protein
VPAENTPSDSQSKKNETQIGPRLRISPAAMKFDNELFSFVLRHSRDEPRLILRFEICDLRSLIRQVNLLTEKLADSNHALYPVSNEYCAVLWRNVQILP